MAILHKRSGTLVQGAADAPISVDHETGAKNNLFTGIKPIYARFYLLNESCSLWPPGSEFTAYFLGLTSGESLIWSGAVVGAGGTYVPRVQEFNVPLGSPILFDEVIRVSFDSSTTAMINTVEYLIYYELVQSTELFMVQQLAEYL